LPDHSFGATSWQINDGELFKMQQPSKATATELFEGRKHYVIPAYQRPYVWTEEDQWAPLWDDIRRVTESHLDPVVRPLASHFLGAVVFELLQAGSNAMTELDVIDGQQRLTTLQLLLDAVEDAMRAGGHEEEAERLEELILNGQSKYRATRHRFKLWPAQANRAEFEAAMDPSAPSVTEPGQIHGAHTFFKEEAARWLRGVPDEDGVVPPGTEEDRARELAETLAARLVVVAIDLTGDDDAQLIFETLNDRGTPLLKADLIKNWVFRRGNTLGADVDRWSRTIWEDFDTEWWREEITQGRASRSRVDIFLHYWLTMRLRDEVKAELVFRTFIDYAEPLMQNVSTAEGFLHELRQDADTYRDFGNLPSDGPAGRFRGYVIEAMELAATTPVFLWLVSPNHAIPADQVTVGLAALESWVMRRTMLQLTTKDINKMLIALLRALTEVPKDHSGEAICGFLSQQTAEARVWPSDRRVVEEIGQRKMYGSVRQGRIAVVLRAIEAYKRSLDTKFGEAPQFGRLSIEHIMPQGWREHWNTNPPLTPEAEQRRDKLVQTLGNLTLVPQPLNSSLSNRPWTDDASHGLGKGPQRGLGKWSILNQFNLQVLNKEVLAHESDWTESDIEDRTRDLATAITRIWQGPDSAMQDAALAISREEQTDR